MQFEDATVKGKLIKRYKRFLADITLETGETVTAHCANSGSMKGCAEAGSIVYLLPNRNPKAKLDWRWELVMVGKMMQIRKRQVFEDLLRDQIEVDIA